MLSYMEKFLLLLLSTVGILVFGLGFGPWGWDLSLGLDFVI